MPDQRPKGRPAEGSMSNFKTAAERMAKSLGITPLDYMLHVLNTSNNKAERMDAAKAAAPYCHARLQAIDVTGVNETKVLIVGVAETSREEWARGKCSLEGPAGSAE